MSSDSRNNSHLLNPDELVDQFAKGQVELQSYLDQLSKRSETLSSNVRDFLAVVSGLAAGAAIVAATNLLSYSWELLIIAFGAGAVMLALSLALARTWREYRRETASIEMALEMYRYLAVRLRTEVNQGITVSLTPYLDQKKEADSLIEKGQKLLAKVGRKVTGQQLP